MDIPLSRSQIEHLLVELKGWKPADTEGNLAQQRIEQLDQAIWQPPVIQLACPLTEMGAVRF
jgi:hypothetical protein